MRGKQDLHRDVVIEAHELTEDAVEHLSITEREQAGHILEQKGLRLEFLQEPDIVLEQLVPRVRKEALGSIDGKSLARGTADEHVELALAEFELGADLGRFHPLDVFALRPGAGMILLKGVDGLGHAVIGIEAPVLRFAEAFGDAPCPAEQVDG